MSVEKVAEYVDGKEGMRSVSGSRVEALSYMCATHEGRGGEEHSKA